MQLKRVKENPILEPKKENWWESGAVFNPGATLFDGKILLFYRAIGEYAHYISRFGLAESEDGIHFKRQNEEPIFVGEKSWEVGAVEDPRIAKIGDDYYITYVCLEIPPRFKPSAGHRKKIFPKTALAKTRDFKNFEKLGVITPKGADDRDVVIFPKKIKGKYLMFHRPYNWVDSHYGVKKPSIWLAESEDLLHWQNHRVFMAARENEIKIGAGAPPVETDFGWIFVYHRVEKEPEKCYKAGLMVLDKENPEKILADFYPVLTPEADYEKEGDTPNVVFPAGALIKDGKLMVYYGGADKVCCLAFLELEELKKELKRS
jgi:predicted GH43/DUF377 family glycosyl hydrolase